VNKVHYKGLYSGLWFIAVIRAFDRGGGGYKRLHQQNCMPRVGKMGETAVIIAFFTAFFDATSDQVFFRTEIHTFSEAAHMTCLFPRQNSLFQAAAKSCFFPRRNQPLFVIEDHIILWSTAPPPLQILLFSR
jgi:hypothetical protein